jgi:hypothetical protein
MFLNCKIYNTCMLYNKTPESLARSKVRCVSNYRPIIYVISTIWPPTKVTLQNLSQYLHAPCRFLGR